MDAEPRLLVMNTIINFEWLQHYRFYVCHAIRYYTYAPPAPTYRVAEENERARDDDGDYKSNGFARKVEGDKNDFRYIPYAPVQRDGDGVRLTRFRVGTLFYERHIRGAAGCMK